MRIGFAVIRFSNEEVRKGYRRRVRENLAYRPTAELNPHPSPSATPSPGLGRRLARACGRAMLVFWKETDVVIIGGWA